MHSLRRSLCLSMLAGAGLGLVGCSTTPGRGPGSGVGSRPVLAPEQSRDVAIHALGLVGTPYRYGGNTVEGGFDCSGLIGYVVRESTGLRLPRTVAQLADVGAPVGIDEVRTGDLVVFGGRRPDHAGIYVGDGRFVHAPSTGGEVRMDRLDGVYWSRRAASARRI